MSDRDPREQQPPSKVGGTETQPRPNVSTEHQREGDARDPSDTLDRRDPETDDRGDAPGGLDQQPVEDRPNVGTVKPEDYPEHQ